MAFSSVSFATDRDNFASLSPLSPTIIHYHQKYQSSKVSHDYHRFHKQQRQKISHRNSSLRSHSYNRKQTSRNNKRRQSSTLWETHRSSNGRIYYYNIITDQSQWEKPSRNQLISSTTKKTNINTDKIQSKSNTKSVRFILDSVSSDDDDDDDNFSRSRLVKSDKIINNHKKHRRIKDHIELFEKCSQEKTTPTSPPPHEIIQMDLVDPFPSISLNQHQCLYPSTVNTILQLEYSNSNESIEHKAIHSFNDQTLLLTYQLISLRTDLYFLRLRIQRNRFQLCQYHFKF